MIPLSRPERYFCNCCQTDKHRLHFYAGNPTKCRECVRFSRREQRRKQPKKAA